MSRYVVRLFVAGSRTGTLRRQVETCMRDLPARQGLGHVTVERASEPPQQSAGSKYRAVIPATVPSSRSTVAIP